MSKKALVTSHLSVNYDRTPVLWDISLEIPSGLLVGIIGPNGAGKSTFIKAILGLVPILSGRVDLMGLPLKKIQSHVAYVPQRASIDWDFPITVLDLVMMGLFGRLGLFRWPSKKDRILASECLDMVGMLPFADRQIGQLSGGQQQRAFFARALIQQADIYFMDEPFAGVDLATEKVLIQLIKELKNKGKTLFIVHHDLNSVESIFDWVVLLNMRLVAVGPLKEIFTPENLYRTYGKSYALLDEALKLSQTKTQGLKG